MRKTRIPDSRSGSLHGLITLARSQSQERQPDLQHGALIAAQGAACAQYRAYNGV